MHSYFDEITTDRQAHGGIARPPSGQTTTCGFQRTPPCALIGTFRRATCVAGPFPPRASASTG